MGAFQRGQDAFGVGEFLEGGKGFVVGGVGVFDATDVLEIGVFRADGGVVESSGNRVGELDLAVVIGEQPGLGALKDAKLAALETGSVLFRKDAETTGLDADHADRFVVEEGMEQAHRIRSATDAGDEQVRKTAFLLKNLLAGLDADHAMEIADHHRERMRAEGGAENVVGVIDRGDPVAHRFIDRFLEGGLSGGDGADLGPH